MKSVARTIVALGAVAALAPVAVAHAEPPFVCNGSPEIPESYACVVRFQVGADPVVTPVTISVPAQSVTVGPKTVTVPGQHVFVPSQPVHVPQICAGPPGFCVGPFDASTPTVDRTTPSVSQTVPAQTVATPGFSQTVPLLGISIPPGAVLVVWYKGTCYYLWPDGTGSQAASVTPDGCP